MSTAEIASTRWIALGTDVVVAVTDAGGLEEAARQVRLELEGIDLACSRFRADSELARLNSRAGEPVRVSALLLDALRVALDAAERSAGLVDPTVGAALIAAGYDVTFENVAEDGPAPAVARMNVPGWRSVQLDASTSTVRIRPGTRLDLGATGKAFAADRAARSAAAATGSGVLVSCGGDLAVEGTPPEGGWPVAVTAGPDWPPQTVAIDRGGLATSGTGVRRWRRGGVEMHHIIDPRTGAPAQTPWQAVSVTGESCVEANITATTAILLGWDAPAWLEEGGAAARLTGHGGSVVRTAGWPL